MSTPIRNLGYCVVFSHMEQGWDGLTVVVTHSNLAEASKLVEVLSGYHATHERYTQQVFNLTEMYHKLALEIDEVKSEFSDLADYSPESLIAINKCLPVDYTAQVYPPLGMRMWINRKWDLVQQAVSEDLKKKSIDRSTYKRGE